MSVNGKNFTSNLTRLLKHLDRLGGIQREEPVAPVMMHLSLTNKCNLNCTYCCYGDRDLAEELPQEDAVSAIKQFSALGTKGLEITGGGDPSLYSGLEEVVQTAVDEGMTVGLITNGIKPLVGVYDNLE